MKVSKERGHKRLWSWLSFADQGASEKILPENNIKMSKTTTTMLKTPEEMLVYLRHHAKSEVDIEKTIFNLKMSRTWEEMYKALNEQSREKLAKTYAYLKNLEDILWRVKFF